MAIKKAAKGTPHSVRQRRTSSGKKVANGAKVSKGSKETKVAKVARSTAVPKVTKVTKSAGLMVPLLTIDGKSQGTIALPKEIFGKKPNKNLIAQAVRVYFANLTVRAAHTKTRSEVRGGGRKPWRQKGTGRARAGSIRSPIWVGGGVALGPRPRVTKLTLPKKMKRNALFSALSTKANEGSIKVITNLESVEAKTKKIAGLLSKVEASGYALLVAIKEDGKNKNNVQLAARNIPKVTVMRPQDLNAYEVIKNNLILFSKESLGRISETVRSN